MSETSFLIGLQESALASFIGGDAAGSELVFPIVETLHVLGLGTVFGSIFLVDLRLLGVVSRDSPVSALSKEILPWTWVAFVVAALSGSLLFISRAVDYWENPLFRIKFIAMLLAGINMIVFHRGAFRRVAEWDRSLPPPLAARFAGGISIALWTVVVFMGRWAGFTD